MGLGLHAPASSHALPHLIPPQPDYHAQHRKEGATVGGHVLASGPTAGSACGRPGTEVSTHVPSHLAENRGSSRAVWGLAIGPGL